MELNGIRPGTPGNIAGPGNKKPMEGQSSEPRDTNDCGKGHNEPDLGLMPKPERKHHGGLLGDILDSLFEPPPPHHEPPPPFHPEPPHHHDGPGGWPGGPGGPGHGPGGPGHGPGGPGHGPGGPGHGPGGPGHGPGGPGHGW